EIGHVEHPEWFPGDATQYSEGDFQALLHQHGEVQCSRPCAQTSVSLLETADSAAVRRAAANADETFGLRQAEFMAVMENIWAPKAMTGDAPVTRELSKTDCQEAQAGSMCFHAVEWLRKSGIAKHPTWYPSLTPRSSPKDVQALLHTLHKADCAQPCEEVRAELASRDDEVVEIDDHGRQVKSQAFELDEPSCGTTKPGEWCYQSIQWLKNAGLRKHPDWYPKLSTQSSIEDFQTVLHKQGKVGCLLPCKEGETATVGLMRQGQPLEIVLNSHSKRKTTTVVSYFDTIRTFGDDALVHQGKAPAKTPLFFHSLLGDNFTSDAIAPGGAWWNKFGLGDKFYSYKLEYDADRGTPLFQISGENATHGEEVLAAILHYAKCMAEESADGKPVKDTVITVPSDATLRQRQAIVAAAEIAGLRLLSLVHETSSFAVQRAVDYTPEKGANELMVFYNLGSRKTEVSVVRFGARSAGMVAGKMAPDITVVGSAVDFSIGGHLMDLKIANKMLATFKEKFPKSAEGIDKSPRALRKLLSQAQKSKAILSSNKVAPFNVESLFDDIDFQAMIKREDFEDMCKEMFDRLTVPLEKALQMANATLADIHGVEVVGGAWRVPKVQSILTDYLESGEKKLPLGQHLNGEEAGALGAALVAANSSSSFRVKKIFFSDFSAHEYAVQVVSLSGDWEKNYTILYPAGSPLGGKKKLTFNLEEDFAIKIFENGVLITEYTVTGLKDVLEGKWSGYNLTAPPKVSATVPLAMSGIIEVKTPTATVEENYWVNVTVPKASTIADVCRFSPSPVCRVLRCVFAIGRAL
ncbi:unnamed protein product, partial [Prorocentrum cordatum]